jgi:hypothetical protein
MIIWSFLLTLFSPLFLIWVIFHPTQLGPNDWYFIAFTISMIFSLVFFLKRKQSSRNQKIFRASLWPLAGFGITIWSMFYSVLTNSNSYWVMWGMMFFGIFDLIKAFNYKT